MSTEPTPMPSATAIGDTATALACELRSSPVLAPLAGRCEASAIVLSAGIGWRVPFAWAVARLRQLERDLVGKAVRPPVLLQSAMRYAAGVYLLATMADVPRRRGTVKLFTYGRGNLPKGVGGPKLQPQAVTVAAVDPNAQSGVRDLVASQGLAKASRRLGLPAQTVADVANGVPVVPTVLGAVRRAVRASERAKVAGVARRRELQSTENAGE